MTAGIAEVTEFLNVDLDIHARSDLRPLVAALAPTVRALYCEKSGRGYFARLELARQPRTPDEALVRFSKAIARLPTSAKRLWDRAAKRELSIGVQGGVRPWVTEYVVRPSTMASIARLEARVLVTVYGRPNKVIGPNGKGKRLESRRRPTRS